MVHSILSIIYYILVVRHLSSTCMYKCAHSQCGNILLTTDKFSSHSTGENFQVRVRASCKSSNVIHAYLIMCRRCGKQYVGETGQLLHCRINNHCYDIMRWIIEDSPVAEHFNSMPHSQADMAFMVIDMTMLQNCDPCLWKIREGRWIRTLGMPLWEWTSE